MNSIKISNYQSLKDVTIDLGDITMITGKSDCGKTALFRAVKGVVTNQSGKDFITAGEKEASVDIDGVTWIQSSTKNEYRIGDEVFEKCGRGVPEKVQSALGMGEFEFGKDIKKLLNFSGQLDQGFIVQGNPATNAKIVGAISNIHVAYNALRDIEKDSRELKRSLNSEQKELGKVHEEMSVAEFEFDRWEAVYKEVERIYTRAKEIKDELFKLDEIKASLDGVNSEIKKTQLVLSIQGTFDMEAMRIEIDAIREARGTIFDLQNVMESITEQAEIIGAGKDVDYSRGIELTKVLGLVGKIKDMDKRVAQIAQFVSKDLSIKYISSVIDQLERITELKSERQAIIDGKDKVDAYMEKAEKRKQELLEVINSVEVCDSCGAEQKHWRI